MLREGGRLVSVAEEPPQASGVTSVYFVVEPDRGTWEIAALLEGGWARPAIDSVFPLERAASAFERSMVADKRGGSCSRWRAEKAQTIRPSRATISPSLSTSSRSGRVTTASAAVRAGTTTRSAGAPGASP